jgi:hypothetical protein
MEAHPEKKLSKSDMLSIFEKMGELCKQQDLTLEIAVYGGSAIMLEFDYRSATFDIDFVPVSGGADKVKTLANAASKALNFPEHILRDDVSLFVSDTAEYALQGDFPKGAGNLRVFTATPEYIFAMKMLAMRSSMETQDLRDIWELADACDIKSAEEADTMLAKFYPKSVLPLRNKMIIEDVFQAKNEHKPYSPMLGW